MSRDEPGGYHLPVMPLETLRFLAPQPGETMLDGTLGGGGHSALIAARLAPGGVLIGLDRDPAALKAAADRLASWRGSISIILLETEFGNMFFSLAEEPLTASIKLDGVLLDLGVSSHQLDAARGFSFRRDEPLNMRMDGSTSSRTAADLLAEESETEIARILWEYGEERFSRRIAAAIVARRAAGQQIKTTGGLAALIESAVPRSAWPREIHVATRSFQAIRIALNRELDQLKQGLEAAMSLLTPGGRLVVISYHSLEDRIVKQAFAAAAGKAPSAPGSSPAAFRDDRPEPTMGILTRKPSVPEEEEVARNPRARSARLRAARRL